MALQAPGQGFDFTFHMRRLCEDMVCRLAELKHIDLRSVTINFCQARKAVPHGLYASLTPMRFEGGNLTTQRRGRLWTIQRLYNSSGREMLYVLSFYLPRFLENSIEEKLKTIIHELWHIGPKFDGDLRRHPGRFYVHSHSQREYDLAMEQLVKKWRSLNPPEEIYTFLQFDYRQLVDRYGCVYGVKIPAPKLIPLGQSSITSSGTR